MHRNVLPAIVFTVALAPFGLAQAGIECWTNKEGIRECGNAVPPEYVQQGHEVLNRAGIVKEKVERAKTPEEIAEEARLAEIKAREEEKRKAQEEEDKVLLNTFTSEREIELSRDSKVATIDTEITIASKNVERVQTRLEEMRGRAAAQQRDGRPVAEKLQKEITDAEAQENEYRTFIDKKTAERSSIISDYDRKIQRFRELKGVSPAKANKQGAAQN